MVPQSDRDVGMLAYSTGSEGIGGSLRRLSGDFVVSEVLYPEALSMIGAGGAGGGYAVYTMRKSKVDTRHAIARVRERSGLRLRALGLKDAAAEAEQYVCTTGRRGPRPDRVSAGGVELRLVGYSPRPLSGADMAGNRFSIRVRGASAPVATFGEYDRIANYYGHQRFGSARPVSHLVGRALLRGDYRGAAQLLLSFTSPHDRPEHAELRQMMADPACHRRAAGMLPRGMDLERIVLSGLIEHGDARRAMAAVPVAMRRLFAQAYQSYLFNVAASSLIESGEDIFSARAGDVCYGPRGEPFRHDGGGGGAGGGVPGPVPAVPLAGYAHYRKTRFEGAVSAAMEGDGAGPRDFLAKGMPEIGLDGGFRSAAARCTAVSTPGREAVSFELGRGSYATTVMREIMKPAEPLACGF